MNKGIRLWLDDSRAAPEGWVRAHNVEEAQVRLLGRNVEDLSLDFDLDNPECSTCQFKCGYQDEGKCGKVCACHRNGDRDGLSLVQWMVERNVWPKHKPVVHSTSGRGAEKMKLLINRHFTE